jgi:hypothetical protein
LSEEADRYPHLPFRQGAPASPYGSSVSPIAAFSDELHHSDCLRFHLALPCLPPETELMGIDQLGKSWKTPFCESFDSFHQLVDWGFILLRIETYSLLMAAIFLVHNLEEFLSFDRMPKFRYAKKITNRKSFLFSIVVLSLLVIIFSVWGYLSKSPIIQNINIIVLFSLTINAIQHGLFSIRYRKIVPGTLTALFFVLPVSALFFMRLYEMRAFDCWSFVQYSIVSSVVMIASLWITLWIGNRFANRVKHG